MILCSISGCNHPHFKLLVVMPQLKCTYDFVHQRERKVLCGTYAALCRTHYRKFLFNKHPHSIWSGRLFNIQGNTFKCCNSRCQYSATEYFWKSSYLGEIALPPYDRVRGIGYCAFHAEMAQRGVDPSPLRSFSPVDFKQYKELFVQYIMEE